MPATYERPELVKYALVDGVGGACTHANTAADCSCDCATDFACINVLAGGQCCENGNPTSGTCGTCDGLTCIGCLGEKV